MLFCSWAKEAEAEEGSGEDDKDDNTESDVRENGDVRKNNEELEKNEETAEGNDRTVTPEVPAIKAPTFFCKWATEDDDKSEEEAAESEEEQDKVEEEEEKVLEKVEEDKVEEPPPPKEVKPVMFMKWATEGDDDAVESSEEEPEPEEEAKLEPESEEEEKGLEAPPAPEDDGGWMVRMVEDAEDDLLSLPLAPRSQDDDGDPFDSVFSSAKPARRKTNPEKKKKVAPSHAKALSDDDDNYLPDVDNTSFAVIDDWDDYVADTIEGNDKQEKERKPRKLRGPYKKRAKEEEDKDKKVKPGLKPQKPGPASRRRGRHTSSMSGIGSGVRSPEPDLDLSRIRLNVKNDVVILPTEKRLANLHIITEKANITLDNVTLKPSVKDKDSEDEDVPLARRRKSGSGRKRKGDTAVEGKKVKKSKTETRPHSPTAARRRSQETEVGWPRLSSVFSDSGGEESKRARKPTAKVQPFVHVDTVEPEKEKKRLKPKDRKLVTGTKIHKPAKGPYSAACKLGSYRCPLCYTEWSLNQPYGRHIIGQACQVELPGPVKKKGEEDDEAKILRYVTVTPATAKRDSSVRMGKVASLALLCRSSLPSDCPASLPGVKEGLEYYHSLYSPYNRTVQARLFATLRQGAKLNLVAGLTGYEKLCREPLKIAIYLERKISLARSKLGSRHPRTKGWVAKYQLLLSLPIHDLFLVAASPYRVLEFPLEGCGRVGLMCLACPGKDCPGCPKVTLQKTQPKITLKIKKEVVEKKHKKKDKKKKEKRKEKASLPSGLVMTCSSCSTVFNSVTGLGEHRRICKAK